MKNESTVLQRASTIKTEAYWMPFTHNRYFKKNPLSRTLVRAEGAYYTTAEGKRLFDCLSGLWCCPLGHAHPKIAEAVAKQVRELDYSPAFQMGHPKIFSLAERIVGLAPAGMGHVFFGNSGSEAVDTALKIARTRLIGRERGYHGVGIGGISVGGIAPNRKMFAPLLVQGVDHLPHTHSAAEMAFSRGQPKWGAHLAEELERLVALHDASTIAAVIVEPMQGSGGVIVPPAGYLERLRQICDRHGILLVFDEVITGFGRLGEPFGAQRFGVTPDMIAFAKIVTNGVIPMGGVIVKPAIYDAFMTGPETSVELFHGYTYSGHPVAAAAAHAALDAIAEEGSFKRARELEPVLERAVHSLKGEPGVVDIRNIGLAAAVELEPIQGKPGARALKVFERGMEEGMLYRFTGDTIAMAPPFISTEPEIEAMIEKLRVALRAAR
ncbi:MAG: aminotransferase class III-fold pyridoxal phosphate-dependent enzyme [Betaproteobacteria bacterium]|nr:MAG: aminotransferase class III-fold pyridoxal phosphate-dependent enzyme [Betaproteobacteria bacterium]